MNCLCDEVIQLIIYELNDPTSFALASKRFYQLSQDPYTRAHYFIVRYGKTQAMYHALGRGKILSERVLDILLSSGAHLSRYLIQVALHHYFHTTSHFIKTPWVRTVPLPVFTHFLRLASERYDEIPRGRGDDDGTLFISFLKESRFPTHLRRMSWETIRDILEKYHFIPFSNKDPIMVQFPLVLAIEPRLLPYAVANGFYMDSKYRDFVFRKIFEKPPQGSDRGVDEIVQNVKELCRLDDSMFVSRTVAAEVCMEAKSNEAGYAALKQLDKSGDLLFDLASVVEELIKLFLTSRSVTSTQNSQILRHLFTDFPSSDPSVRMVILLTVFTNQNGGHVNSSTVRSRLEPLNLGPLTRVDICNLFINPFLDRYNALLEYMRTELIVDEGKKGLSPEEMRSVVQDVAVRCLEMECKGKMLRKLKDGFPIVTNAVIQAVLNEPRIDLNSLPPSDDTVACDTFTPKFCKSDYFIRHCEVTDYFWESPNQKLEPQSDAIDDMDVDLNNDEPEKTDSRDLGTIGRDNLTTMIRQDEISPTRSRRRLFWGMGTITINNMELSSLDSLPVGKWIKDQFGAKSCVTAVFMTHAVLNENSSILRHYLSEPGTDHVPVTLKHFKLLARLGRSASYHMYTAIQGGAPFYRDEDDYLSDAETPAALLHQIKVKLEAGQESVPPELPVLETESRPQSQVPSKKRRRPTRKSVANAPPSYYVPDSDDDAIAGEEDEDMYHSSGGDKKETVDHLSIWIKHLTELLRAEQSKHRAKKKKKESEAEPGTKIRLYKNEFFKSLSIHLRTLRKVNAQQRLVSNNDSGDDSSDNSDDEYRHKPRQKRQKPAYA